MSTLKGKRLVVLGCGYIGTEVARGGLARGMQVTTLTRNLARALALKNAGLESVVADLATPTWHDAIPGGADYVLNCVSGGGGTFDDYRRSYARGMASVVEWAQTRGAAGTLVYTSSTSVYPQDGGVRVGEEAPTEPAGERGAILREAEQCLQAARGVCRRWFILRLAGIYGPGRHHLLGQVRTGEVGGHGDFHLNLAYRDDICAAIWAAFGAPDEVGNRVYNVADDGAATKAEVAAFIARRLGLPMPRFSGEPAGGRRAVTPDRVIGNDAIKRELGWVPAFPTFREGYTQILSQLEP